MPIRWDFGTVYREIRLSKGLTQKEVCGEMISRTSLTKFENNEVVPKFENMMFLLDQLNISNEEFLYICDYYQPSKRQEIFNKADNYFSSTETTELKEIMELCENHLRTTHDVPIEKLLDLVIVFINIREHGILNPTEELKEVAKRIWNYLEKMDEWYERDFKLLNAILFTLPIDTLVQLTDRLLDNLEKYENFLPLKNAKLGMLTNISTTFLYNNYMEECERLTLIILELAK